MLNATKALLLAKSIRFGEQHGVSGWQKPGRLYLSNEMVKFKRGGILGALCQHLGEASNDEELSLQHLLYTLPYDSLTLMSTTRVSKIVLLSAQLEDLTGFRLEKVKAYRDIKITIGI